MFLLWNYLFWSAVSPYGYLFPTLWCKRWLIRMGALYFRVFYGWIWIWNQQLLVKNGKMWSRNKHKSNASVWCWTVFSVWDATDRMWVFRVWLCMCMYVKAVTQWLWPWCQPHWSSSRMLRSLTHATETFPTHTLKLMKWPRGSVAGRMWTMLVKIALTITRILSGLN